MEKKRKLKEKSKNKTEKVTNEISGVVDHSHRPHTLFLANEFWRFLQRQNSTKSERKKNLKLKTKFNK